MVKISENIASRSVRKPAIDRSPMRCHNCYTVADHHWSPISHWDVRPSVTSDCDMLGGPMRNECQGNWILIGRFQFEVHDRSAVRGR